MVLQKKVYVFIILGNPDLALQVTGSKQMVMCSRVHDLLMW